MRTQQKFLALIMAIILSLLIIPATALAAEANDSGISGGIQWEYQDGTLTISPVEEPEKPEAGYESGQMPDWNNSIEGHTLNDRPWAKYSSFITKLDIKDGVKVIGRASFQNLTALTGDIVIPDSVEIIKGVAFSDCTALTGTLKLGNSIREIGANAFKNAPLTGSLLLPDTLEVLGQHAFNGGNFNGTLTLSKKLNSIANYTFYECNFIGDLIIPDSVTSIGDYAFSRSGFDGGLAIGNGVGEIKQYAFYGSGFTGDLTLGAELKRIGIAAFKECKFTGNLTWGEKIEEIDSGAFCDVKGLKAENLKLLNVKTLEASSFKNCENFTGVLSMPAIQSIDEYVIDGCDRLSVIDLTGATITSIDNYGLTNANNDHLVIYISNSKTKELLTNSKYSYTKTAVAFTDEGIFTGTLAGNMSDTPVKAGWQFMGWSTESDAESGNESGDFSGNQLYYATWKECPSHEMDGGEVTTAATCTDGGEKTYTCTICGATETEEIPALGHSFTNYVYNNDATYERDGTKTALCDHGCGEKDTVTDVGSKLVYTSSGGASSVSTGYPVTVSNARNGTVSVSPRHANKGATVTITVKPDKGYEVDRVTVTDKDGKSIKVTEGANNKYTFTMPSSKVTVEAIFAKIEEAQKQSFTDVPNGYWAEDAIAWAARNGYINGNTAATFNPEGTVTRQQLWMILARLSGEQPADFTEAKDWAVSNWLTDGTNPGTAVSRQQLVTILYRYAVGKGYDTADKADLTQFPDHASVASYAADAMAWSVANGIVGGTTQGTLDPNGTATRAQFAVILNRFCDKIMG